MRTEAAPLEASGQAFGHRLAGLRTLVRPAAGLLLAAAAALVVGRFAQAEHETLAITEGRFLALEIGLVLAAVGGLCRSGRASSFLPQLAAGATVLAALALPALPTRSATVLVLLLAAWLLSAAPLVLRPLPGRADFFFVALGLQALARPDLLLGPWGPRSAALVLMPALAALALHFLAERFGGERCLYALAVVALLAPGLNVNATLLLLAAAAGTYAGDPQRWLPARGAAAALLLLPLLMRWPIGILAAAAGAVLLFERMEPRRLFLPAAAALGAALGLAAGRPAGSPQEAVLVALALAPAALWALREQWRLVTAGVLLAAAAPFLARDPESWAAGGLLLALAVPVHRPFVRGQRALLLMLVAGGLLLAGFPWLRPEPLLAGIALVAPSLVHFLAASLLLVALPGLLAEKFAGRAWAEGLPAAVVAAAAFAGFLSQLPPAGLSLLGGQPQSLVAARPNVRLPVEKASPSRQVVVDSALFHGAELEAGQEVASLLFYGADGGLLLALPLRAGDDTADWAAAREDAQRRPDFRAPPPWLSQVSPDGLFFSGRFRRVYDLPRPIAAAAVELRRAGELPPGTQVAIYELELRP